MFKATQKVIDNHGVLRLDEVNSLFHFWLFVNSTLKRMLLQELAALRFQLWSLSGAAFAAWLSCMTFTVFFSRALLQRHKRLEMENRQQSLSLMVSAKMSSLGEMAGNIAHEINSPLAAIRLNAEILQELLKDQPFPQERAMTMTHTLIKMVDKISKIISSMLNFARNVEGEAMSQIKVKSLMEDVMLICQDALKRSSVSLQLEVDENVEMSCRPSEISQVLLNLIKNSIDAVEVLPEKWIRIRAHQENERILIEVTDSGSGIPPELQQRIFEPFFSTKPRGKGTGLGLGIAKKLIEANKGSLSLNKNSAHTSFIIELPAKT
jgi:C4-dicarboxylate-specific signal transduction histidine kinase